MPLHVPINCQDPVEILQNTPVRSQGRWQIRQSRLQQAQSRKGASTGSSSKGVV